MKLEVCLAIYLRVYHLYFLCSFLDSAINIFISFIHLRLFKFWDLFLFYFQVYCTFHCFLVIFFFFLSLPSVLNDFFSYSCILFAKCFTFILFFRWYSFSYSLLSLTFSANIKILILYRFIFSFSFHNLPSLFLVLS